jgi:serine protease Do/serine protease DegQ
VGSDPDSDVAVIKIKAAKLTALRLADSDKLRVGDFVVAIGNPFGLGQTVTSGIVSALARSGLGITGYDDLIQTDASINPGNSGGALVNLRGELVGINTAIYSQSGGNIGIGFAIPVNMAHQIMQQLVSHGQVKRGYLGAQFQDLNPELAEAFGLHADKGAVVVDVTDGSPAALAGLVPGDVITHINGRAIGNAAELRNQIGLIRSGEKVEVGLLREGAPARATLVIADRDEGVSASGQFRNERFADTTIGEIPQDSPVFGRLQGVMAYKVDRGSRAWSAGLRAGDIIVSVNRQRTPTLPAFLAVVNQAQGALLLSVHRGNQSAYLVIK